MSDDEADPELLELLRQSLGLGRPSKTAPPETKVLESARYVFDNAIDVALDPTKTKEAAETIWRMMQERHYSTKTWASHELHPKTKDASTVDFIFTMDLLNFSFWSEETDPSKQFAIEYRGRRWTGYWSLVAALQRALDEEIPITSSDFWQSEDECTDEVLRHVFRSATVEEIPLFKERAECLREAGKILYEKFGCSFANCIADANHSAAALVNLLAENFPCFRDETRFEGKKIRFYKRAQILVADLWACFQGKGYGQFDDIHKITMFADYRIPQMLHQLGCLLYSPPLETSIRRLKPLASGSQREIELRGASIWCVELIRQEIERRHPEVKDGTFSGSKVATPASPSEQQSVVDVSRPESRNGSGSTVATKIDGDVVDDEADAGESGGDAPEMIRGVNAILIDFLLYDWMKELEKEGKEGIPHHRTRSIWY